MAIEFDGIWVVRAWMQLDRATDALNNGDVKTALYYIARALSNLQSGVYPIGDGWSESVGDKLDYATAFLDDIYEILKEHGGSIPMKERDGRE
ncbi:hypothetical protein [Thermococcus sp.]